MQVPAFEMAGCPLVTPRDTKVPERKANPAALITLIKGGETGFTL